MNKSFSALTKIMRACCVLVAVTCATNSAFAQEDAPGRVARLSYISGSVSFAPAGSDQWAYAEMNRPLTTGDSLWVDGGARGELHIGSSAIRLNSASSLNVLNLNDDTVQLKLSQGDINLRIRYLPNNQNFEVDTPNLAFSVQEPGEYRISVASDGSSSLVTVRNGYGTAYGDNDSLGIRSNEQIRFSGTNLAQSAIGTAPPYDDFDGWILDRDRAEDTSQSARYVSREMTGYEQLDANGTWDTSPEYGAVWIPRVVAADWSPYRTGHWAWIGPWGWTWVDDSPWGFAPYHYGRWARLGPRWCWVPGPMHVNVAPVYAPALVAFVGGSNFSLSISAGGGMGGVAWFPLGPGERYNPGYRASPTYITNINRTTVVNNVTVNNVTNVYVNQNVPNAVIAVPTNTFVRGQSVVRNIQPVNQRQFANASVATAAPQVAPTRESILGAAKPVTPPIGARSLQRPVVATMAPPAPVTIAPVNASGIAPQLPARRVTPAQATTAAAPSAVHVLGGAAPIRRTTLTAPPQNQPTATPAPNPASPANVAAPANRLPPVTNPTQYPARPAQPAINTQQQQPQLQQQPIRNEMNGVPHPPMQQPAQVQPEQYRRPNMPENAVQPRATQESPVAPPRPAPQAPPQRESYPVPPTPAAQAPREIPREMRRPEPQFQQPAPQQIQQPVQAPPQIQQQHRPEPVAPPVEVRRPPQQPPQMQPQMQQQPQAQPQQHHPEPAAPQPPHVIKPEKDNNNNNQR